MARKLLILASREPIPDRLLAAFVCVQAAGPANIVGERVRVGYSTSDLVSKTGTIIEISYVSKIPNLDDPMGDPRVYVLQLEMGPCVGSQVTKSNLNDYRVQRPRRLSVCGVKSR